MKKLLFPFAVAAVLTGCVAVRLKPGASVAVTTTNAPPVVNNVVTNPITIPNSFVASLDTNSQKVLVDAILAAGDKQIKPAHILLTNVNPINAYLTNVVVYSNSIVFELDAETKTSLTKLTAKEPKMEKALYLLLGAFFSGLLGFVATLGMRGFDKRRDTSFLSGLFAAIKAEAEQVDAIYATGLGAKVKEVRDDQAQKYFPTVAILTVEWFPVFAGNTQHIGRMKKPEQDSVLKFHTRVKDLVETFRTNNRLLEKYNQIDERHTEDRKKALEDLEKYKKTILWVDRKYAETYTGLTGKDVHTRTIERPESGII